MRTYTQREDTTFPWWLVLLEGILSALGVPSLNNPRLLCARSSPGAAGAQ